MKGERKWIKILIQKICKFSVGVVKQKEVGNCLHLMELRLSTYRQEKWLLVRNIGVSTGTEKMLCKSFGLGCAQKGFIVSKRHKVEGVFKLLGVWWKHVKYKRDGEWRHCYAPKHTYHTIFSKSRLTKEQIKDVLNVH